MVLDKLIKNLKSASEMPGEDEYVELDTQAMGEELSGKALIKIEEINDFGDSDRVQKHVREGHIVFAKIAGLKNKDMSELKRAVDRIKRTCMAVNGDIAGVDEDWIVITPHYAKVHRGEEASLDVA